MVAEVIIQITVSVCLDLKSVFLPYHGGTRFSHPHSVRIVEQDVNDCAAELRIVPTFYEPAVDPVLHHIGHASYRECNDRCSTGH